MSKYAFNKFLRENKGKIFEEGLFVKDRQASQFAEKTRTQIYNKSAISHLTCMFNQWFMWLMRDNYKSNHKACINKHTVKKWVNQMVGEGRLNYNRDIERIKVLY